VLTNIFIRDNFNQIKIIYKDILTNRRQKIFPENDSIRERNIFILSFYKSFNSKFWLNE